MGPNGYQAGSWGLMRMVLEKSMIGLDFNLTTVLKN
jgi:hypothetical protein